MKQGRRARFVSRGRERALWLLGAAVLIAVLLAIAQPLKWPVWAQVVLAGLAVAAAPIIPELRALFEQGDTRARLVEERVAIPVEHGQLPQVREVGLGQLRVHAARMQVPYIERDQQNKLEEVVGPGQAVLVVGHSMSGKTRLAAEVVKRKFPDASLVPADSGKALRELFDGGLDPAGIVVWLDDLERFLGAEGLTVGLLNRLTTGRAIVVATIRVKEREKYRPRDELQRSEWEVIKQFSEISLERRLTDPELDRVQAMVDDPGVLTAVDHYGLAEYLGAGPDALDKFKYGETEEPVGHALVQAAVDWRRTGLIRPASKDVLVRALPTYLADRRGVPRTSQAIEKGLAWATEKINETVALLGQDFSSLNGPAYDAFDYLVDQLTRSTGEPVPDPIWALALEQSEPAELVVIGIAAYQAGKLTTAETAWRQAAASGGTEIVPEAAVDLGVLLEEQGNLQGAQNFYQQAIDSGHREWAPMAAVNLGYLLSKQGERQGAQAAWQQAIDSGHGEWTPMAAYNLGEYQRAIDSGHPYWAPMGEGALLEWRDDLEGAKAAYQRAIDSGPAEPVPGTAARNLGYVLFKQGDLKGAQAAWQQAIDSGHSQVTPMAAVQLGELLEQQGHLEDAKALYRRAIDSGHAQAAPLAAIDLGGLLEEQGDFKGAKDFYQLVIDSNHPEYAPMASVNLGYLLSKQGERQVAQAAYQRAIDSNHPEYAPMGAVNLGYLLHDRGDFKGAKDFYQQAIDSNHPEWAPMASVLLGLLLQEQGHPEGAKAAYQQAIESRRTEAAPLAKGALHQQQGDFQRAKDLYQLVIGSEHPVYVPLAAIYLGGLLEKQGDLEGAKAVYQQAIDCGNAVLAPRAVRSLERLLRSTLPS